jgi:peroxiredoxin
VLAGAGALLVASGLGALFLWMTPKAAAREIEASCTALAASPTNPVLGALPGVAPDFSAQAHDGAVVKLSDYLGKVVVLNFWASWCNVCQAEKPSLSAMTRDLSQRNFAVVTLASDRNWAAVKKALPSGSPFRVLLDPPAETFVIDKRGKIRMYLVNKRAWDSSVARTCLQALIDE